MRIDSHQHFWIYEPDEYSWIGEGMEMMRCDILPGELEPILAANQMNGCITVQSEQNEKHNSFLLGLAAQHDFIKAVVGWVDLRSENIRVKLEYLKAFPKLKGFRHILQGESKRDMMLEPAFIRGLQVAGKMGYTYDVLIYPDQLPYVISLMELCPGQKFVLDHLGKPAIKSGEIKEWKNYIQKLAAFENLYCKISGMVTEADWKKWRSADLVPYIDAVVEAFGVNRLMFGSDWPVCLAAAGYDEVTAIMEGYFSSFTIAEQQRVFGGTAVEFYNLK